MCNKILLMISPVVFLPLFVIAIVMGMNDGLLMVGMIAYIVILIKNISK